jgi:hypothetical protein
VLDVGAPDDGDAEEVDVADDVVDGGLADLSLPHPVTATPTIRMLAAKPAAIIDTFVKMAPLGGVVTITGVLRNIAGRWIRWT